MDGQEKRRFRFASLAILPVILAVLAGLVPAFLSATDDASALSASEWEYTVRAALNTYVANQFTSDPATEYGFVIDAPTLKSRIDSNNDGVYLGEGDDAAGAPVLVDVLEGQELKIPTTAVRSQWNTTALQAGSVNAIASYVNNHEMAGFSSDVVVYCLTGHTESAAAGGLGAVAGAGGLGGNLTNTTPKVLGLKWGRAGWGPGNDPQAGNYNNFEAVGTPAAPSTAYDSATNAACDGVTPGAEQVRCAAEWALSAGGGNVGNGVSPSPWDANWQAIDLRPGAGNSVFRDPGYPTLAIPVNTIFNTGLNYLNPAASPKKIFVGDTQHIAGMIATGAEMLGYDSGFLKWGLANYNKVLPEKYMGSAGYEQIAGNTAVDDARPEIAEVAADAPSSTSATIKWTTNEPATSVVVYSAANSQYSVTASGTYDQKVNDTVLHASHSVTIEGLEEGTTYNFKVSSFDGMANGSITVEELSFTAGTPMPATPVTTEQVTAPIPANDDDGDIEVPGDSDNSDDGDIEVPGDSDNSDDASNSEYDPLGSNNPSSGGSTGDPAPISSYGGSLPETGLPLALAVAFIISAGGLVGIHLYRKIITA